MLKQQQTIWQSKKQLGLRFCAAFMVALVLLSTIPLANIIAADTMECCKGLVHGNSSCANGMCPMMSKPKPEIKPVEKFCGTQNKAEQQTLFAIFQEENNQSNFFNPETDDSQQSSNGSYIDILVFSSSCESNCCVNTFNRNQRAAISISVVAGISQKPRPPTKQVTTDFTRSNVRILNTLHRECQPRAPPQIKS